MRLPAARPVSLLRVATCRMMSTTTKYRSTRGGQTGLLFDEAVLQGLATDRGLLVPEEIPSFPPGAPEVWRGLKFEELAYEIMSLYIGPKDIEPEVLKDIINRSYATFRDPSEGPHHGPRRHHADHPAPLVQSV